MIPRPAVDHYKGMQRLQIAAGLVAARAWRSVDSGRISESWTEVIPSATDEVAAFQVEAARRGSSYTANTLASQGLYTAPDAWVDPSAFGGWSSRGKPIEYALYSVAPSVKSLIAGGMPIAEAMQSGQRMTQVLARTQVADAARTAAGVDTFARRGVMYTRMLNPPSCSRCAVLAGRMYRNNEGFLRHPNCFPAGTTIGGPALDAATRRWYEGELVTLTTASGKNLSLTANHPILTRRGWVPAHLLNEGDEVFRSSRPEGAAPLVVPDHNQVPSLVEDVWGSFSMDGFVAMPSTPEDFHGDGQDGEVNIAYANGALRRYIQPLLDQHVVEHGLPLGIEPTFRFDPESAAQLFHFWGAALTGGSVGGGGLTLPLPGGHGAVAKLPGFARSTSLYASGYESPADHISGYSVLLGQGVLSGPALVGGDDFLDGELSVATRWDAPALPFDVDTRDGYASRGLDLLHRLSRDIEGDRLVQVTRVQFSGHVYSPSSSEGWLHANSLIVSNCDCVHVATSSDAAEREGLVADPYEYFESLSEAEQDRLFTASGAQAIRDGADLNQVVNSRRGMKYAGESADGTRRGQRALDTTREGTTRRGYYGGRQLRSSFRSIPGERYTRTSGRLTPDAIYSRNLPREQTLELLRTNGYLLSQGQVPTGAIRGMGSALTPADRMTAAERRLQRSRLEWEAVQQGRNPYGKGPLTPQDKATAENNYRRWLLSGGQIYTR